MHDAWMMGGTTTTMQQNETVDSLAHLRSHHCLMHQLCCYCLKNHVTLQTEIGEQIVGNSELVSSRQGL